MFSADYVIVGAGMTAHAAARGLRDIDRGGAILMIGAESDPPYKRPPLSKGLWTGSSVDEVWSRTADLGVDIRLDRTIDRLDPEAHEVVDADGQHYRYTRLLLATGGRPRRLPLDDDGHIIYFRTLADYRRLRSLTGHGQRFAVIGGGFIGSEIAAALATNGKDVTLIFPERGIGDRIFPADLSRSLNEVYRDHGVEVRAGETVSGLDRHGDGWLLGTRAVADASEHELAVDGVVAGIGTLPNVELARDAGLEIGDGIVVDRFLRTSHPDIYAAGDVASAWVPALGTRQRVEHEDNARTMGRHAGRAMAGQLEPYDHLPSFYSDLFEQGYEAVGELDSRMETIAEWTVPFHEGTVYYLRNNQVRGVLLWNVWDRVEAARDLIRRAAPVGSHLLTTTPLATA